MTTSADARGKLSRYPARNKKTSLPNPTPYEIPPQTTKSRCAATSDKRKIQSPPPPAIPSTPPPHSASGSAQTCTTARTAAGQNPINRVSVNCEYPRSRNSSKNPTSKKYAAQNIANLRIRPPWIARCPNSKTRIPYIAAINNVMLAESPRRSHPKQFSQRQPPRQPIRSPSPLFNPSQHHRRQYRCGQQTKLHQHHRPQPARPQLHRSHPPAGHKLQWIKHRHIKRESPSRPQSLRPRNTVRTYDVCTANSGPALGSREPVASGVGTRS